MANYDLKINLASMFGAKLMTIDGKKSIVLPIEENSLFVSEKTGAVYANWSVLERKAESYGQTHFVKAPINKQAWSALPEELRKAPIIGNMSPSNRQPVSSAPTMSPQPSTTQSSASFSNDNLPF
jgi:hypothetical protein